MGNGGLKKEDGGVKIGDVTAKDASEKATPDAKRAPRIISLYHLFEPCSSPLT
jgi:hypothetical protein